MKTMKVVIPGVLTTVQDLGRFGYQKSGMTCSGVMDTAAYRKANYLVGNEEGAAVLEMPLYGGSCRFEEDTVIALTGADMQADGESETNCHEPGGEGTCRRGAEPWHGKDRMPYLSGCGRRI